MNSTTNQNATKPEPLPDGFQCLYQAFDSAFKLRHIPPDSSKEEIIKLFTEQVHLPANWAFQMNDMKRQALWANIRCGDRQAKLRKHAELLSQTQKIVVDAPDVLDFNLLAEPTPVIHRRLTECQQAIALQICQRTFACFTDMQKKCLLGGIHRHGKDPSVRRYTYPLFDITESSKTPKLVEKEEGIWRITTVTQEKMRTHEHKMVVHTIWDARDDPATVPMTKPPYVENFLKTLLPWLRGKLKIVSGKMVREDIILQDRKVETWTDVLLEVEREIIQGKMLSPAVCFGDFVLTGWGDADLR